MKIEIEVKDNSSNGDIIKSIAKDIKVIENSDYVLMTFPKEWWEAKFKE